MQFSSSLLSIFGGKTVPSTACSATSCRCVFVAENGAKPGSACGAAGVVVGAGADVDIFVIVVAWFIDGLLNEFANKVVCRVPANLFRGADLL